MDGTAGLVNASLLDLSGTWPAFGPDCPAGRPKPINLPTHCCKVVAFIRVKKRGGRRYAYLVESVWDRESGAPRQKVLAYLGPADEVKPSDVPARLRRSPAIARWLQENAEEAARAYEAEAARTRAELRAALLRPGPDKLEPSVREAVRRWGEWAFLDEIVTPLMHAIGEDWYAGRLTAVDEHLATRRLTDVVRRMREDREGGRPNRPPVLLANPDGEMHSLALEMLELRVLMEGHRTVVLSGGLPRVDLAERAREWKVDLALVSATLPQNAKEAVRAAEAILQRSPRTLVALGGQAWTALKRPPRLPANVRLCQEPAGPFLEGLLAEVSRRRQAGMLSA